MVQVVNSLLDVIARHVPVLRTHVVEWAQDNPWPVVALVVALLVVPGLVAGRHPTVPLRRRDPRRAFDHHQKQAGFARAGGRCEMDGFWGLRCRQPANHGDHWWPWSRGGATSLDNFVAACQHHNLAKSDRWPSAAMSRRIRSRRGPAHQTRVGARYEPGGDRDEQPAS